MFKANTKNIFSAIVLNTLLIGSVYADELSELNSWVQFNLTKEEQIICQHVVNNDYFFVARSDGRLKTGYRLNLADSDNILETYILSWSFKNIEGDYIGRGIPPEIIVERFYRDGRSAYVEKVAYYYVYEISKPLSVEVGLKKYNAEADVPTKKTLHDDELLNVLICNPK